MKAWRLLAKYGDTLVGKRIMTEPWGSWPGGPVFITELLPDEDDETIVFMVRTDGWEWTQDPLLGSELNNVIGVFDNEEVELLEEITPPPTGRKVTFKL